MQTKLTLRLEEELINRAKAYSRSSGKSLSQMVADYFAQLEASAQAIEFPPVTSSLKGALKGADLDEAAYRDYLTEKYR